MFSEQKSSPVMMYTRYHFVFAFLLGVQSTWAEKNVPFMNQGFQFDYTPTTQPVPIPTTAQCDTIPLSWSRAAFTTGPNPQAPYLIQVYTSAFLFPMVIGVGDGLTFDWPVPYVPGTQYQICMFDANGQSGGCQRMTTVVPAANSTLNNPPVCLNLTYPAGILDVTAQDHTGALSQYGWVDQCTDISIKPNNGTPPFILTVAPTLHPPWNITSNDMSPINWTVQLSWGSSFFISLVDSSGQSWAFGPLHSGGQGSTGCLAGTSSQNKDVSESVAIGSGIGGLVLGLLAGAVLAWLLLRRRTGPHYDAYVSDRIQNYNSKGEGHQLDDSPQGNASHYTALPNSSNTPPPPGSGSSRTMLSSLASRRLLSTPNEYEIEPFRLPDDPAPPSDPSIHPDTCVSAGRESSSLGVVTRSLSRPTSSARSVGHQTEGSSVLSPDPSSPTQTQQRSATSQQVYVVHHDGGRAPVTVYTPDGTEVIELPPRYDGSTDQRPSPQQRRTTGSLPSKGPRLTGPSGS